MFFYFEHLKIMATLCYVTFIWGAVKQHVHWKNIVWLHKIKYL